MAAKGKSPSRPSSISGRPPRRGAPPPIAVSQPRPWGLIAATVAVVVFAAAVIGYAVVQVRQKAATTPEAKAAAAAKIEGISVVSFPSRQHKQGAVTYQQSPPFGGDHDPEWADCTGTVYPSPIRNENAVHSLEHGAVWITYQPDLPSGDVDKLRKRVEGTDYMLMSPYPALKSKVSVQSWGHQLFVDSVDDKRLDQFIKDLRLNSATTPEFGAQCTNPAFKATPRPPDGSAAASPSASAKP
jgi:hypothetical protein